MVRKSERNKLQGTPEKLVAERTRKSTRQASRRKKKSSSESEGEPNVLVDKDIKEVGELSESKPQTEPEGPEVKQDGARSRRSIKRHPAALQSDKEQDHEQNSEWKEDPSFWHSEGPAPQEATGEPKVPTDDGTTWKVQSSNGAGGEIQKLKICRQRVSESNDSSSPSKEASPKRRKSARLTKNLDTTMESSESAGDTPNEKNEENVSPQENVIPGLEDSEKSILIKDSGLEFLSGSQPNSNEGVPDSNVENDKAPNIEDDSLNTSLHNDSKPSEVESNSLPEEVITDSDMKVQEETEIQNSEPTPSSPEKQPEENELSKPSRRSSADVEPTSNVENPVEEQSSQDVTKLEKEMDAEEAANDAVVEDNTTAILNNEEKSDQPSVDDAQSEEGETKRSRTVSENSESGKGERKVVNITKVKVTGSDETTPDEIIKKLNERAARFSKEFNDNKEIKKKEETVSSEPKSPREEGELTPVLETKKPKHTTIVINRPKEVSSQPTKLKRNTEDLPPSERKRRLIPKSKPKDKEEDPVFNISSQSLMLLVPEVKTITPEEVSSFPLDDEDLSKFEMEQPSESCARKKVNLKTKDVEVRVQNDNRQVFKKKHIVIETINDADEMKAVGPKLPLQENHRVVRKISLLSEDVKKVRRSPSPSGKAATEVLFITNLVRPFTIPQLRELLARTGTIAPNGFYIDKIKSKCYVKYTDVEMAVETRHALNGVRWPVNNPKMLKVDFATAEDMTIVQKLAEEEAATKKVEVAEPAVAVAGWLSEQAALKPQRRVTTAVREWDMGKVGTGATEEKRHVEEWHVKAEPQEVKRRAASPVEAKYEPPARKVKKRDNDAPARLLDDLFRKTKATPCIYWLPLTAAQIAVKEEIRRQHMAEHERRLAELRKSDHSRRDKDREKSRDSRRKK